MFLNFGDITNAFSVIITPGLMRQIGISVLKYIWKNKGPEIANKNKF